MTSPPRERVPVLTEVVRPANAPATAAPAPSEPPGEAELAQRVLDNVQRQVDLLLEQRLREAIAPVLARLADSLVRETREELASALREMVSRALAQELSRHRDR